MVVMSVPSAVIDNAPSVPESSAPVSVTTSSGSFTVTSSPPLVETVSNVNFTPSPSTVTTLESLEILFLTAACVVPLGDSAAFANTLPAISSRQLSPPKQVTASVSIPAEVTVPTGNV